MTAQIEADFVRLLELKRELLTDLLTTLRRSAEHLKNGDTDSFNGEMDKIGEISAAVDDLVTAEVGLKSGMPPRNGKVAELEQSIKYILGQIELAYNDCKDAAQEQLRQFGQQIKSVRGTQKGIEGYAGQRYRSQAAFVDEKK